MTEYYIYEREMYGDDYRCTEGGLGSTIPVIIEADSKEEAKSKYLKKMGWENDEDEWKFYAVTVASTMRFVCEDCGKPFGYPKIIKESRGEYWGIPCTEDVGVCPHCGSGQFF